MSGLSEQERESLRLVVWPVEPQPDPGSRDLYVRLEAAVAALLAARTEQARPEPVDGCPCGVDREHGPHEFNLPEQARPEPLLCINCHQPMSKHDPLALCPNPPEARPEHVVKAEALREAADDPALFFKDPHGAIHRWLRDRADALEVQP